MNTRKLLKATLKRVEQWGWTVTRTDPTWSFTDPYGVSYFDIDSITALQAVNTIREAYEHAAIPAKESEGPE